ncbi:glucose dehydrogenase [FAD, quinone]-like [Rhagoletis pomonella]|uniref:glucose dehydrogenase [FAD, quinone]-like n=1 Tax=Rhagoletis pomonella TaxID=28610 RepID=UPI001786AD2D|nr:glucose dehydrogenase [FAD, quinone]-like [Rhagoletis pomonella]
MSYLYTHCGCPVSSPLTPTLANICGGSAYVLFMGLLEVFLRSQCDIEDPCGRATPRFRSEPDSEYDFVVIGGGTAGSAAAARLSEVAQWKVLVIETGDDEPIGSQVPSLSLDYIGSDIDYKYTTQSEKVACLGDTNQACSWPRGKVLGGTSVINGMMYNRGNREDYDNWASLGNTGWSYDDILPFYKKSENNLQITEVDTALHAVGGPLPVSHFPYNPPLSYAILRGGEQLGLDVRDLNGYNATGVMKGQMASRNGIRHSAARSFLRPARNRENLHILLNSTATRVLFEPNSTIVNGVELIDSNNNTITVSVRKEVVVSAGALDSPKVLLLSGIGPADELEKVNVTVVHDLPGVGKNLHNHVSYSLTFYVNETNTNTLNWATASEYLLFRNGLLSGTGIGDMTAKISTKYAESSRGPDVQVFFGGYSPRCSDTGAIGELLTNGSRSILMSPVNVHPKSRGSVTLASNNPRDNALFVANYLSVEHDAKALIEGIKFAIKLGATPALQEFGLTLDETPEAGCTSYDFGTDEYWDCAIRYTTAPENHQAGSLKMGPANDTLAVVDNELRVYGVQGLRVMDTSIMPVVTSGNTHAPAIMIAEKGVYHIKQSYGIVSEIEDQSQPQGPPQLSQSY